MKIDADKVNYYYNLIAKLMNTPSCQAALKVLGEN